MTKRTKILYWIATLWLALGMLSTGVVQLLQAHEGPGAADMMAHLGYPAYFGVIVGAWKVLGVVALLIPGKPLLKEWAYAGFFFIMTGAVASHLAAGSTRELFPSLLLLLLTVVSWYFRPVDRKPVLVPSITQ